MGEPLLESLRREIRSATLPQAEIARRAGVPESVISRLVRGERGCSVESAERIAAALGLALVLKPLKRRSPR
jgi:plasmid maintenance system antidote protein VapI